MVSRPWVSGMGSGQPAGGWAVSAPSAGAGVEALLAVEDPDDAGLCCGRSQEAGATGGGVASCTYCQQGGGGACVSEVEGWSTVGGVRVGGGVKQQLTNPLPFKLPEHKHLTLPGLPHSSYRPMQCAEELLGWSQF